MRVSLKSFRRLLLIHSVLSCNRSSIESFVSQVTGCHSLHSSVSGELWYSPQWLLKWPRTINNKPAFNKNPGFASMLIGVSIVFKRLKPAGPICFWQVKMSSTGSFSRRSCWRVCVWLLFAWWLNSCLLLCSNKPNLCSYFHHRTVSVFRTLPPGASVSVKLNYF